MCPCFVKKSENCKNAFIYDIICSKIIYYTQIIDNCEIKDENTDNLKMSFAKYFIADLQPLSQLRCRLCQASPVQGEGGRLSSQVQHFLDKNSIGDKYPKHFRGLLLIK